jgi:hypothetical protein
MPAMDKTGPFGTGPVGLGRGLCQQADSSSPAQRCMGGNGRGQGRRWGGRGNGGGGGGGFGGSRFGQASLTQDEEAAMLEKRISAMQARVNELKQGKIGG